MSSKYKRFLAFQRNIMPPSLWSIIQQVVILDVLDPEDGSTMLLQNIGNYLPVRTAQYYVRPPS
jgi:hypothetical protein